MVYLQADCRNHFWTGVVGRRGVELESIILVEERKYTSDLNGSEKCREPIQTKNSRKTSVHKWHIASDRDDSERDSLCATFKREESKGVKTDFPRIVYHFTHTMCSLPYYWPRS